MAHFYRFDDVEIDLRGFRVLKSGNIVALEPKALNLLVFLVENRGRLVEKSELIDAVWGESFVSENVLTRSITQLRKALGEDAKNARYIETVPTRGYRFIASVTVEEGPQAGESAPAISESGLSADRTSAVPDLSRRPELRRYGIAAVTVIVLAAVAVATFSVISLHSHSPYFQVVSSTQVTTSGGLSSYPTFSPDDTEIAYSADRGKGYEIFVRPLGPGGKEFQITSDGNQNIQPAWSPDGNLIAFYSMTRGGIWVLPALGGTSRRLTDFGSHPAWSRDGQWIAFQSGAPFDLGADSTGVSTPSEIWVARSDGSDTRKITSQGKPDGGHGAPSWSPDGKRIVFLASLHGSSWLWSIGADGTGLVSLVEEANGYYDPIFAHDGKSILYGVVLRGSNYGLWQLRVSPDTTSPLGPPVQIINSGGTRFKNLALSGNGKKLVYSAVGLSGSLQSLAVSKSVEPAGEPVALTSDSGCRNILPAFSPDGTRIAFVSCRGRSGVRQQLWLMNADGSNIQQLTYPPSGASYPTWHPDGHRIFFSTGGKIISVDADTRQQKVTAQLNQDFAEHHLSPDGTTLAGNSSVGGVVNIWTLDLESGKLKQLTFDKDPASFPVWSPDGKFIAVQTQHGPDNNIAMMASTGGPFTALTPFKGRQWSYSWSPDGDKIISAKQGDDLVWNIWSVSRSTKIERQLTHYTKTNAFVRYPAMSPRGNQIVYEYTETTGNIWMIELK